MIKNEFLKLTGLNEISDKKYDIIELVYNLSGLDKQKFCEQFMAQKQNFTFEMIEDYINSITYINNKNNEVFKKYLEKFEELSMIILKHISSIKDQEVIEKILQLIIDSRSEQIRIKIRNNIELTDEDLKYISDNI